MDPNLALTTSCFVHKKNEKKKKSNNEIPEPYNITQFKKLWSSIESKIKAIEENSYQETFKELINFIKSHSISNVTDINEIPAAILVMGVNMPDHSNIFQLFEEKLHSNDIPATVVVYSKDGATHSSLMQKVITTIIDRYQAKMNLENMNLKKIDYTFSKLLSYYNSLPSAETIFSPKKSKKKSVKASNIKHNPIVICIQNVEAFNINILQDFILSCNLYIGKLPIVLIFGMSSAMVTLHNILPPKVLCCLGIETFYSMTAIEYLTRIVQEVVLEMDNPFKFGPKVFRLVIDTVLYHDFSVTNLTSLLKFCMLEHFYSNPTTTLCCNQSDVPSALQHLRKEDLGLFKKLPSFSQFIENNPECKQIMKNEKEFKALLADLLRKCDIYYKLFISLLNVVHIWTKDLPGSPFGKHFREIYPTAMEDTITALPCYSQAENLLKMLSRQEIELKLINSLSYLAERTSLHADLIEVKELLQNKLKKLNQLNEASETALEEPMVVDSDLGKITSRSQLQEKLKEQLKAKRSKFDHYRDDIIQTLTLIFKKLHPPFQLPLHEIFYFDNSLAIKRHLMVVPRITIHRNLMNPQANLKCTCCALEDYKQILPQMPDICALYKLHLECGKLINLYDCLEAFKSTKGNIEKGSELDIELNIRFMHTISELQMLGFIKQTKRKTDHMAKLTFGGF